MDPRATKKRKTEHQSEEDEEKEEGKEEEKKKKNKKEATSTQVTSRAFASATFHSNVFRLQVEQMLHTIRRGRSRGGRKERGGERALHSIKRSIENIPRNGPFLLAEAEDHLLRTKIAIPFPQPRPAADARYKFASAPPARITVADHPALHTAEDGVEEMELVVVMPPSLFEDKDYLNYRYFYKRAYYLATIAAGLKAAHEGEYALQFHQQHGNPLRPVLIVTPLEPTITDKWQIHINPCAMPDQFPADKLRLDKNCVRNMPSSSDSSSSPATPFYNSSLRANVLTTRYLDLLHAASQTCESFSDACLLATTWLRQRGWHSAIAGGGFGEVEFHTLMALCLQAGGPNGKPMLSSGYSSYQIFKATLQLLAMKDFIKHPWIVGNTTQEAPPPSPSLDRLPLLWDAARCHNILYKSSPSSYRLLRDEAKSTLIALGDPLHDAFDATFILRLDEPLYRFDYHIRLPERLLLSTNGKHHDHLPGRHLQKLYDILERGLGDRVSHITISPAALPSWPLGSSRPPIRDDISIGLVVHPDKYKRTVDHGPPAENKSDAASFRDFWGDKSELRRFKDGSILESLIWSSPVECHGRSVLEQIIRHLLHRHFHLSTMHDVHFSGDAFATLLPGGTDVSLFNPFMERYRIFENDIRELRDLPLSIRQILPSDPQLCYTSILPPALPSLPIPAHVTLQFEASGRWPDDLIAIQRTKIAFLLIISHMLSSTHSQVTTRIGLENDAHPTRNQAFLDVTYDDSATFRLRIHHDREVHLLQRILSDKTADHPSRESAARGLAEYKRDFLIRPAHTQALIRLCRKFPALSGAVRLTKRWFRAHLLLGRHVSEEVVESMVVRTFTDPSSPWSGVPSTPQTGFLRTVHGIARWDWRVEPWIVEFGAEKRDHRSSETQVREMRTNFEAWRKLDPRMGRVALFVGSVLDPGGVAFTEGRGGVVGAGRMSAVARAVVQEVREGRMGRMGEDEVGRLFESGVGEFDFVISLQGKQEGRKRRAGKTGFKNLELSIPDDAELIGCEDPAEMFLRDLEHVYGDAVVFFPGDGVIAGLWCPGVVQEGKKWRVGVAYSTIPIVSDGDGEGRGEEAVVTMANRTAMLAEMARLGGDLVARVEISEKS